MKNILIAEAKDTHDKLREILIKYNSPEYGDAIVDEISSLFNFPTTIDIEPEEEEKKFLSLTDLLKQLVVGVNLQKFVIEMFGLLMSLEIMKIEKYFTLQKAKLKN